MQQDIGKQFAAMRRAFEFRRGARGVGFGLAVAGLAMIAWFVATLGAVILTGAFAAPVAGFIPFEPALRTAFGLFLGGVALASVVTYVAGALIFGMRRLAA